jgi:hypothetical protein
MAHTCTGLQALNLLECNGLDDKVIPTLTCMSQLTNLQLSSPNLTHRSLSLLSNLPNLRILNLPSPTIQTEHRSASAIQASGALMQRSPSQGAKIELLCKRSTQGLECLDSASMPIGAPLRTGHSLSLVHPGASKRASKDAGSFVDGVGQRVLWHSLTPALRQRGHLVSNSDCSKHHEPKSET